MAGAIAGEIQFLSPIFICVQDFLHSFDFVQLDVDGCGEEVATTSLFVLPLQSHRLVIVHILMQLSSCTRPRIR